MTKIEKINDAINYSGLACPDVAIILNRIRMNEGDDNDEIVNMILNKYYEYIFAYRIQNYETTENFIKTELRLVNLDTFILGRRYEKTFPLPQTDMTKAMFGENDFFEMNKIFHEKLALMHPIRNKNLLTLKTLSNEKKNPTSTENIKK